MEKILGIVHTENLPVTAEAYDVALEISPGKNQEILVKVDFLSCMAIIRRNAESY